MDGVNVEDLSIPKTQTNSEMLEAAEVHAEQRAACAMRQQADKVGCTLLSNLSRMYGNDHAVTAQIAD